ncbi:MAG: agmatine deiminase family protein [Verrucomicrobiota bacterium]|nr:agmatine deiminase family protein [Verrucomicrobiota bacterium]
MSPSNTADNAAPAGPGFSMPAEWEPHEATWLGWPHEASDWPGKFTAIPWVYGEIVRKLAPGERVRILVRHRAEEKSARRLLTRAGCDLRKIQFVIHPTNRGWTRDSGPIFVRKAESGKRKAETAIVHFHFNGWAKYKNWRKDTRVPEIAARLLGKSLFHAEHRGHPFVMEGGGIEVNGRGTLLTTEECYLDRRMQARNPELGRKDIEAALKKYLGATTIFWLRRGIAGDDTHGHIDDLCRFVNPRTLVLVRETNRREANYRPLAENWERIGDLRLEDGARPEIMPLPMPAPLWFDGQRLPASYANFYIANAAVLVPTFNDPNDRVALGILSELFKDRPVVGVHAVDLVLGLGALHCLTQQEPR